MTAVLRAIGRRLARTPLASLVALPARLLLVLKHDLRVARASVRWLISSREHTNLTYNLTARNQDHLAWFVSDLTDSSLDEVQGYLAELEEDMRLRLHLLEATRRSDRRRLADLEVRYARRAGWYAIVRATRPELVVETGTDKGLGSCVIAAALLRNGRGRLLTIDVNPASGYLIKSPYDVVVDRRIGDSVTLLQTLESPISLFIHDSDHSASHEASELQALDGRVLESSLVLSDNSHVTDELAQWAMRRGWRFSFFAEEPEDHWYPGDGIGAARARRSPDTTARG